MANDDKSCRTLEDTLAESGLLNADDNAPASVAQKMVEDCKKAVAGEASAQVRLGRMLRQMGLYDESFHWFSEAASQGNFDGRASLGLAYYHGQGVSRDQKQAIKLIQTAVDGGSAYAKALLGDFLIVGVVNALASDSDRGWRLLREAAEEGDGYAAARIGNSMLGSDSTEGLKWLRFAAEKEDPWGLFSLAWLHLVGSNGVAEDPDEYLRLLQLSALRGHREAQRVLAADYLNGTEGLEKNLNLAEYWYKQAAAQGDMEAAAALEMAHQWPGRERPEPDASIEQCGPYYRYIDMDFMRANVHKGCLGTRWPRAGQPLGFTVSRTPPDAEADVVVEEWTECHGVSHDVQMILSQGRRIPRGDVTPKLHQFGNYQGSAWCTNYDFATPKTAKK